MNAPVAPSAARRRAVLHVLWTVLTVLASTGLLVAAVVVPAPPVVLPFLFVGCVALPIVAVRDLDGALGVLGRRRALRQLRRSLERLPETQHPLGL